VAIDAPVARVFAVWGDIQSYPRFIPVIASVRALDEKRSHWIVRAPLGRSAVFDCEVVEWILDRRIVWDIHHPFGQGRGCLDFRELGSGAQVDCVFEYVLAPLWLRRLAALMSHLGFPSDAFDEGLRRIKREVEAGVAASSRPGRPEGARSIAEGAHLPSQGPPPP